LDLYLEIAGNQIEGARDYQEDAFLSQFIDEDGNAPKSSALVIMADGMGGHAAGNIASNLVVSTFNNTFNKGFGKRDASELLREALQKSNEALKASIIETPALDGMGCTMVTAAVSKGKLWWVSVGDSHLYLLRNGKVEKKNEDHSYGGYLERMKAQGVEVEAEAGLSKNMLMSAMTGDEIADIDCPSTPLDLQAGDRVIVASDGLDTLSNGRLLELSKLSKTPKRCVDALLEAVESAQKPRQDNTTVIVIDVHERKAKPQAAPAPARAPAGEHLGDTQPLPAPQARAAHMAARREPASKGGKGLVMGILAVLALAGAGGGWYWFMGPGKPASSEPQLAQASGTGVEPQGSGPELGAQAGSQDGAQTQGDPRPEPAPGADSTQAPGVPDAGGVASDAQAGTDSGSEAQGASVAAGREFRDPLARGGEGPVMVEIPGGTFEMGSSGLSVQADERPEHRVRVQPFAMSKYEVTVAEYARFARATGRELPEKLSLERSEHPVVLVSWDDAYNYTRWLSEQTGESYRLPTEAEWEYAASGGADTDYWWGDDMEPGMAHCFDCGTGLNPREPTRVGRFEPNPFGLHDTAGNVLEWVHDCYHPSYEGAPGDGSVWEGGDCNFRVARGGAYNNPASSLRVQHRTKLRGGNDYDTVGIRVVRDL